MARAPKTNTTATENEEANAPEGEKGSTPQDNEGTEGTGSDDPVTEPDPKIADLEAINQELTTNLDQAHIEISELRTAGDTANSKIDELTKQIDELLEAAPQEGQTDTEDSGGRERLARGYLLGVVMAMPENYRLNGLATKLDELEAFVSQFDGEDRYIAVELIKSIAHARPNDVPSGRYMNDVKRAFAVLDGENEAQIDLVKNRDEQSAAANRLARVVGASPVPAGFVSERREREDQPEPLLDGTDEQNAAAARFQNAAG